MRFPEWLYRLLPGDKGTQQLGVIWRENTSSAATPAVSTDVYTVPNDKCLVLTNVTARFNIIAPETLSRRRIMADPPAGSTRYNIFDDEGNTSTLDTTINWQGEVIIPGGWKVKIQGDQVPGAAALAVNGELHGYLIPRGTFVFG